MTKSEARIRKALLLAKKRAKFKRQRKKIKNLARREAQKQKRLNAKIDHIATQAEKLYTILDNLNKQQIEDFKARALKYNIKYPR